MKTTRTTALSAGVILSIAGMSYVAASTPSSSAPPASTSAAPAAVRLMGEVVSVDPAASLFVVKESNRVRSTKELSIRWDATTHFALGKNAGSAADLAAGDTVKLAFSKLADGKNLATSVAIIKAQKN